MILAALQNLLNPSMVSRLRMMSVAIQFVLGSFLILLKNKIKSLIVYANPLVNVTQVIFWYTSYKYLESQDLIDTEASVLFQMATENMTCLFAAIGILCSLNFKTFLSMHVPIYIVSLISYDILVTR